MVVQGLYIHLYDRRDDFDFPIGNFAIFRNLLHMVVLFHMYSWYVMLRFVRNMMFSVQMIYSGFKVIESGIFFTKLQTTVRKFYGCHTQTLYTNWNFCVTCVEGFVYQMRHMPGFQLFRVNRDECYMWGVKCLLCMISPIHYIYYTLQNLSVL